MKVNCWGRSWDTTAKVPTATRKGGAARAVHRSWSVVRTRTIVATAAVRTRKNASAGQDHAECRAKNPHSASHWVDVHGDKTGANDQSCPRARGETPSASSAPAIKCQYKSPSSKGGRATTSAKRPQARPTTRPNGGSGRSRAVDSLPGVDSGSHSSSDPSTAAFEDTAGGQVALNPTPFLAGRTATNKKVPGSNPYTIHSQAPSDRSTTKAQHAMARTPIRCR